MNHSTSIPSHGLVADVFAVLDSHGYTCPDDAARGAAIVLLGDVLDGYTGRVNSARLPRDDYAPGVEEGSL